MILHEHQTDQIERTRLAIRSGHKRVMLQAPTGAGKTVMAASIILSAANKGKRVLFLVHRIELVEQSFNEFMAWHITPGVVASGWQMSRSLSVQIAMVQTIVRRLDLFDHFDLIIVDEAHHAVAGTWAKILAKFSKAVVVGLSATPERLDGKGLGSHFDAIVPGPPVQWLIDNQFLSQFRLFNTDLVQQKEFHLRAGEFIQSEVTAAVDKPSITGDAVSHYLEYSVGQRCIVFAASIEASLHIVEAYKERGIPAAHVDGETPSDERKSAMRDFADGKLLVISNVKLFGEGVNVPAIHTVQMLNPTASLAWYLQMVGRGLRYVPDKTAIILDHVGNSERHGFPNAERTWSLTGREKKGKGQAFLKTCPNCYAGLPLGAKECSNCGHVFPISEAREIEQVDGDLIEQDTRPVSKEEVNDMMKDATTLSEWHKIGKILGYKPGWAFHQHNKKMAAFDVAPQGKR